MKLSFSCNSAELLSIEEICDQLEIYGYSGVELSFQRGQFDPENIMSDRIIELVNYFRNSSIKPVCISTATAKFLSEVPHEPSLINLDTAKRSKRSNLILKGILLAEKIGIPLVSFQSGYIRDEHIKSTRKMLMNLLAKEINGLLKSIAANVKLVIEPEPGMFIETIDEANDLITQVNDHRFGLHLDIGHVFCTEKDYIKAIRKHAKKTLYIHMADIRDGFNLKYKTCKILEAKKILTNRKIVNSTLFDVEGLDIFIFATKEKKYILKDLDQLLSEEFKFYIQNVVTIDKEYISSKTTKELDLEIHAYLDSLSGTSYERALKSYNAIATLRLGNNEVQPFINEVICNTLRGKVHYHDLFGNGSIDYPRVLSALIDSGYDGYCTIELYNHAPLWRTVAPQSISYILAAMTRHFGWNPDDFGHIDHTKAVAPYIRVADAKLCSNGTLSTLYDFRLCQPNTAALSSTSLHSLEHCLLAILPDLLPGFLMVGPMGCRTGMYIVTSIPLHKNYVKNQLYKALQAIEILKSVPYQSEKTCGMANDHNLSAAQIIAKKVLNSFFFQNIITKTTHTTEMI